MIIPMCQGLTGAIINIILDPLMIFGIGPFPEMGIRGAALATIIGQICGMVIGLWGVFRRQKVLKVNMKAFKWNRSIVGDIYRVGLPGIVMQSVVSVMTAGMNGILIAFSQTAVNVLGIYFKLQTFVFMPVFGLNQGALPVMGYNYGARNRKRLFGAYKITLTAAVVIMALGLVLFQLLPEQMLMLFVDKSDAAAAQKMIEVGVPALKTISLSFLGAILHSVFCRVRTMRFNAESFVAVIVRDKLLCTCVKCKIHFCILRKFTFRFVVFYQRNKVVLSIAPNHCGT